MFRTVVVFRALVALLVWFALTLPALAQGVGAIGGSVKDDSGAVLPGVTVTLSSPAGTIGGNQSAVTDERGNYQFVRLVPGRYAVSAELAGFQTVKREGIDVSSDQTSRVDVTLGINELAETITVRGDSPLLDATSTLQQTVMSREVLDTIPTANDIWSISRLALGVTSTKYDVGGREMFAQSDSIVHGSVRKEQSYLMDGMDLNNNFTGDQINFYFDTFSAQELNYITGQTPAEYPRGGVIINLITRTGTNQFRGSAMFQGTNRRLESSNVSGALRSQLLAGVPAEVLARDPNLVPGEKMSRLYDAAATFGGPILRDKVWFMVSGKLGEVYRYKVGSYNADGTQLLEDNQMRNTMEKVSWAITQNDQLHFMHSWVLKGRYHVSGGPTVTEFFDSRATVYNPSQNHVFLPRWTKVLSSRAVLDVANITAKIQNSRGPQPEVTAGDLPIYDAVTRRNTVALGSYNIPDVGWKDQFGSSLSYIVGNHDLKFGYQFIYSTRDATNVSYSNFPSGLRAVFRNGVPDSVNTYNTPNSTTFNYRENALYAQDRWKATDKLTINLGLRFEGAYGWLNDGKSQICQEATIFIAARCFEPVAGYPDLKGLAPRFSAIYDVFGEGRTLLKFTANRYLLTQMGIANDVNPLRNTSDTRAWIDANGDRIPQLSELGPSTGYNLGTTNRYNPDLKWPYSNELAFEVEQQLPGTLVASAGYYYRGHRNMIGRANLAVPTDSYIPIQVTERASGRTVTVYNQNPALRGRFDVLYDNRDEVDGSFHGADFSLQKRLSNRWMMMGSLSLGRTQTDIYEGDDLNNPNFTFRRGLRDTDVPIFLKLSGVYELPYGMRVASNLQRFTGAPETTTVRVAADTVALTQVNQNIVIEERGTRRLSSVTMADFNLTKVIKVGNATFEPRLDVFNLLNAGAVTQRLMQLGPAYGNAVAVLGPRLVKLGANVRW